MSDFPEDNYTLSDDEIDMMRERILAFIIPNSPVNAEQNNAVEKACRYQLIYEKQMKEAGVPELPNGVTGFSIDTFSMSFGKNGYDASAMLNDKTVCQSAYAVLLRAGLLYRGLRGGC